MGAYEIGVYGLGVMGSSLAKNIINNGFKTALYSKSDAEREKFTHDKNKENWNMATDEAEFVKSLERPRKIFLMITSGKPVDMVIESLLPMIDTGDVLIDGGNSYFKDTDRRCDYLSQKGIKYMGVGVSGGEKGALEGPSMMVGGSKEGWSEIKHILQKIAAKAGDESCCNYVGKNGAGHYVKMVHNGIEYAILQEIADIYYVMKNGLNLSQEKIIEAFTKWKDSELNSYLIEIAVSVLSKKDDDGGYLIDKILDVAKMKGTGTWTLSEGMERGVYIPSIAEAVFARSFSENIAQRQEGAKKLKHVSMNPVLPGYEKSLKNALYGAIICSYAQGIDLIKKASDDYGWEIDIAGAVALWRNGCIIRSELLNIISKALMGNSQYKNLLLTEEFSFVSTLEPYMREVAITSMAAALAVPTLISSVSYYDSFHTDRMSVNMVQGLRDCFGAHTYQRIDKEGIFHSQWE